MRQTSNWAGTDGPFPSIERAGEDAWKAQCEAVSRRFALLAPHDAQVSQQTAQPAEQPSRFFATHLALAAIDRVGA